LGDRITVCATCREGAGRALADHLASEGIEVRLVECLNACGAPLALAVTGEGKATYLFAGVDPAEQAGEVLAFAGLYRGAPRGEVADARACGNLRFCLRGRIPA
jgi:predicted metal-binding protein